MLIVGAPQETAGFLFILYPGDICINLFFQLYFLMPDEKKSPEDGPSSSDTKGKEAAEPAAEDQMAAYEEDLKNTDWGHQPC